MNKITKTRKTVQSVGDFILVVSAIGIVCISVLDFLGLLDGIQWLSERIPTFTLLALGLILGASVIDRWTKLDKIESMLQNVLNSQLIGAQYLEDSASVIRELESVTEQADEFIMALGGKSTAVHYLEQIEEDVKTKGILYYRLLAGSRITNELKDHLLRLLDAPNVQVYWTSSEKFGNLTVTEKQVIIALPTPYKDKFVGIKLPGEKTARIYSQHFLEAMSKSIPVKSQAALKLLGGEGVDSPLDTPTLEKKIRKLIGDEMQNISEVKPTLF